MPAAGVTWGKRVEGLRSSLSSRVTEPAHYRRNGEVIKSVADSGIFISGEGQILREEQYPTAITSAAGKHLLLFIDYQAHPLANAKAK